MSVYGVSGGILQLNFNPFGVLFIGRRSYMSQELARLNLVKAQILEALSHPESEEGLFFSNFAHLHEEDERSPVEAKDEEILDALEELIREGKVRMDEDSQRAVFHKA